MELEDDFEKSLIRTIDVYLKQVFGEPGALVIYQYLQSTLSLRQEEIPKKLEVFSEGLNKFLSSGARVVEKVILDGLYSDFGQEFQFKEGYNFADYVEELKKAAKRPSK
ncbi:MAG: hypothetical protein OEY30_00850 [Candidatus Bathyarchaeota archaeon]|nr:hypothetical protein [Candidatus Bathyarchaeota archaeon]